MEESQPKRGRALDHRHGKEDKTSIAPFAKISTKRGSEAKAQRFSRYVDHKIRTNGVSKGTARGWTLLKAVTGKNFAELVLVRGKGSDARMRFKN